MTQRKKQILLSIFFLILYAPINCMNLALDQRDWSLLPCELLLQKIIPLLNFKAQNNLGKSCKKYYEAIKPASLTLTIDECKRLNTHNYINAIMHYANKEINASLFNTDIKTGNLSGIRSFINSSKNQSLCNLGSIANSYRHISILSVNAKNDKEKTELHEITLKKDYYINWDDHAEAYQKQQKSLQNLLKNPIIEINIKDTDGNTAIHYAANFKLIDQFLAIENVDLNVKNNQGETPLFYSLQHRSISREEGGWNCRNTIIYNDYQFERLCNDLRTDVNTKNNGGETPLHHIIRHPRLTRKESQQHAYLQSYNYPTFSYDNTQTKQLIAHPNININMYNNNGETPLHYAVQLKQLSQEEIERCKTYFDETSLIDLKAKINIENMKLLLDHKDTIIDPQNNIGETPLMYAIKDNNIETIKLLCTYANNTHANKKLNINLTNNNGYTALDYAIETNNKEIIDLLEKHGATHGSPSYATGINNKGINDQTAKPKTTPVSFFGKHKKAIQICSLIGIMGIFTSIMIYVHYH